MLLAPNKNLQNRSWNQLNVPSCLLFVSQNVHRWKSTFCWWQLPACFLINQILKLLQPSEQNYLNFRLQDFAALLFVWQTLIVRTKTKLFLLLEFHWIISVSKSNCCCFVDDDASGKSPISVWTRPLISPAKRNRTLPTATSIQEPRVFSLTGKHCGQRRQIRMQFLSISHKSSIRRTGTFCARAVFVCSFSPVCALGGGFYLINQSRLPQWMKMQPEWMSWKQTSHSTPTTGGVPSLVVNVSVLHAFCRVITKTLQTKQLIGAVKHGLRKNMWFWWNNPNVKQKRFVANVKKLIVSPGCFHWRPND